MKKTHVCFILDASGSMQSVQEATVSGFNEYIQTLKGDKKSKYSFSLTLFNTEVDKRYREVVISEVEKLSSKNYRPNGSTALYDAACSTVTDFENKVGEDDKAIVVILTDGEENASKEYDQKEFRHMIERLQKKGNWTFVYMGANQDAWANAQKYGFHAGNVASFNSTERGMVNALRMAAVNTSGWSCQSAGSTTDWFSAEDQKNLKDTI